MAGRVSGWVALCHHSWLLWRFCCLSGFGSAGRVVGRVVLRHSSLPIRLANRVDSTVRVLGRAQLRSAADHESCQATYGLDPMRSWNGIAALVANRKKSFVHATYPRVCQGNGCLAHLSQQRFDARRPLYAMKQVFESI